MKKLALSLAVLFGVAMVSCGGSDKNDGKDSCDSANKTEQAAPQEDENKADEQVAENDSPKTVETTDSVQAQ